MQQSPLMLWRFVLMLIGIRRSKDLLEQFQEFKCSSLFAFNSCVYCTTRYNKCGRIGTKWLFFFTFIEECCVVIEKNIDKKLANRISYQIWYKGCLKGKFGRGEGGSAVTPGRRIELFEVLPAIQRNPRLQVNFVSFRSFWPRYGKKYNSCWYVLNIRTLWETLEKRWKYLLTAKAQRKMWGSKTRLTGDVFEVFGIKVVGSHG